MQKERTLLIIKPDGVQRNLIGEIIRRIERTGLKLVAMKFIVATKEQAYEHYKKGEEWLAQKGELRIKQRTEAGKLVEKPAREYGMDIVNGNVTFMTAGPVVPMVWEGNQAVGIIKKLVGTTEPLTSDVGTIRGDLTIDSYDISNQDDRSVRNLVHCTDNPTESDREINLWFKPEELVSYKHVNERMLYDVNLEGILE